MNDTDLLRLVRDKLVHRSADGRSWAASGAGFLDVTEQAEALLAARLLWFDRNAEGWHALARLTGAGESLVGGTIRRAPVRTALTAEDADLAVRLYRSGESVRRTARTLRTSEAKIRTILADAGVPMRRPGHPVNREATAS